jgi:hypothetical protein
MKHILYLAALSLLLNTAIVGAQAPYVITGGGGG